MDTAAAIRDMDRYDSYPLTDDLPSDVSLTVFEEMATWSNDEEDNTPFHAGAI
jgi:hypothetical protein